MSDFSTFKYVIVIALTLFWEHMKALSVESLKTLRVQSMEFLQQGCINALCFLEVHARLMSDKRKFVRFQWCCMQGDLSGLGSFHIICFVLPCVFLFSLLIYIVVDFLFLELEDQWTPMWSALILTSADPSSFVASTQGTFISGQNIPSLRSCQSPERIHRHQYRVENPECRDGTSEEDEEDCRQH